VYHTYNTLNQAPCETAAYLAAECHGGKFTVPQLATGNYYSGPSGSDATDRCQCNTVYYSVISDCAGCQMGTWLSYDQWHVGCKSIEPDATFPQTIASQTLVPAWAFVKINDTSKPWDNVTACIFGDAPESSGSTRPLFAPQFIAKSTHNVGMPVGVATGSAVLILAVTGAGVWYFVRRRRRRGQQGVSSTIYHPTEQATSGSIIVPFTPETEKKFYNPSDPSTYPNLNVLSRDATQSAGTSPTTTHGGAITYSV